MDQRFIAPYSSPKKTLGFCLFARLLFAEFFSMVGGLLTSYWFRQNFIQSKEIYNVMNVRSSTSLLVSWCFKPSQTQRITSGLRETLIKR